MSISQVEICNMALLKIGDKAITDLKEDSKEAKLCRQFYDITRDKELRSHPWNFSMSRAELAELTETPAFGWAHKFQLPNDCLRIIEMSDRNTEYIIEGRELLTNSGTAKIIYQKSVTDTTKFDMLFVGAFSLKLAMTIAFPLTADRGLVESLEMEYQRDLRDAKFIDALEGNQTIEQQSSWLDSRR